jgi:hypothetical protein
MRFGPLYAFTPSVVLAFGLVTALGCGSSGQEQLSLGQDDGGPSFAFSGTDAGGQAALDAYIEQNQVAVKFVTLSCAGDCATVQAVGTGGYPPYSFKWENGSTSATRQVCPTSSTTYSVRVTDAGTSGELARAPETVQVPLAANVIACPDGGAKSGLGADAGMGTLVAEVTVPGTTDIWLAGQPDGTMLTYTNQVDVAPANSPVEVPVVAETILTFSATGSTSYTGGICYGPSPDGGCLVTIDGGPANGISSAQVPADALIGVFVGAGVPGGQAPAGLDFSANTSFAMASPLLGQVFFIGDGLTGTGSGVVQQFVVPAGATRLFLASSDDLGASTNNTGQFAVAITSL